MIEACRPRLLTKRHPRITPADRNGANRAAGCPAVWNRSALGQFSQKSKEFSMRTKLIHRSSDGQRTYVVVLETGEEAVSEIKGFADREKLEAAQLTAIGAFSDAVLGYFDWEQKHYQRNPVTEQVEVAAFIGDIALSENDERSLHVHVVLGRPDASGLAGHLLEAHVRPTLEVILTEYPAHLRKRHDPESGLALIDPGE
jgi:predicted DNA-binding protein with PD1-like motif